MVTESERLYDCIISYHLITGQVLNESFRNDLPTEVWATITQEYSDFNCSLELHPSDTYAKVLLPKSNISYITMKVLSST